MNRHIRAVTDDYASHGFTAIAPGLFDRVQPGIQLNYNSADSSRGMQIATQIGFDKALLDVNAAINHAAKLTPNRKVGVVGFCWGGSLAWLAATRLHPAAVVAYYGGQIAKFASETPHCPVMLHFGAKDKHIGRRRNPENPASPSRYSHPHLRRRRPRLQLRSSPRLQPQGRLPSPPTHPRFPLLPPTMIPSCGRGSSDSQAHLRKVAPGSRVLWSAAAQPPLLRFPRRLPIAVVALASRPELRRVMPALLGLVRVPHPSPSKGAGLDQTQTAYRNPVVILRSASRDASLFHRFHELSSERRSDLRLRHEASLLLPPRPDSPPQRQRRCRN